MEHDLTVSKVLVLKSFPVTERVRMALYRIINRMQLQTNTLRVNEREFVISMFYYSF